MLSSKVRFKTRTSISTILVFSESDSIHKLIRCIDSLYCDFLEYDQIVLVANGGTKSKILGLKQLQKWEKDLSIEIISSNSKLGFGEALNLGVPYCKNKYIARIDPDDISMPGRLKEQSLVMDSNMNIAVCGGWAGEMHTTSRTVDFVRKTPITYQEILKQAKYKNPMVHPSTLIRKEYLDKVGGYPKAKKGQDYLLWVKLLNSGYELVNIPKVVVWVDQSEDFFSRRSFSFFKNEAKIFLEMRRMGFIGNPVLIFNLASRFLLRVSPTFLKRLAYRNRFMRGG